MREARTGRAAPSARVAVAAGLLVLALAAAGSCRPDASEVAVTGVVSTHPENDCRFAGGGPVRPVLASVPVVFTAVGTGRRSTARIAPASVRTAPGVCLQTGRYRILVPRAGAYLVQVRYVPVFGGPPRPVRVTFAELRRKGFRLDLTAEHSTGE